MRKNLNLELPIAIGSDHAGVEYKTAIIEWLTEQGYTLEDKGPLDNQSVDYPDYAHPVANDVEKVNVGLGILICGSGNGVAMTANKHSGIRAALCWNEELAELARLHNNANIICIPARFVDLNLAKKMVEKFINTDFEGGRHENRVNKIIC